MIFPRNYRLLRILCIVLWYFPENNHFLARLQLEEQSFSWLSLKQRIEINLLLDSKETMINYLYLTERYSGNEIFGNFLGNDLKDLSKSLKFYQKNYPKPRRKIFRRGPKDKGSRRVFSTGPRFEDDVRRDYHLQLENEKFQRKKYYFFKLIEQLKDLMSRTLVESS
jgi:hypothetical protein